MGHHDHLWRRLVNLEETLETLEKSLKIHNTKEGRTYCLKTIEELKQQIREVNRELDALGDFKYN